MHSGLSTKKTFSNSAVATNNIGPSRSRQYPDEPRVGIGVVALRRGTPSEDNLTETEVLLVRRAKPPEVGKWTFPGGSLELGETMVECAVREAYEETGLHLRNDPETARAVEEREGGLSTGLEVPTPFAAADVIVHEDSRRLAFHYAIVEVAAVPADPSAPLVPGGDVDGAQWKPVRHLKGMTDLTKNSAKIAEEAARRFSAALEL
ncbi:hypothetical protein WJX75_001461 [Coccomyxa subellipsoidea]|uniref:Nudix hydrolase domain-containing protein n=1 Tax=Coccomyxa subellipsoidea TaxID=248742 RepID=A0ABR2YR26_9CHLO